MNGITQLQAKNIARKGRYGDDEIMHVSKAEIAGLDALARNIYGHPLPRNPHTGQKEAFLFLPFLAPFLASSVPALAGMGALGTGLAAGALGTAEAAARGMDNPLQQGLMTGLTAGGMSAIGSAASGAASGVGGGVPMNQAINAMGTDQAAAMAMQNAQAMGADAMTGAGMLPGQMQQSAMNQLIESPFQGITGAPELFAQSAQGGTPSYMASVPGGVPTGLAGQVAAVNAPLETFTGAALPQYINDVPIYDMSSSASLDTYTPSPDTFTGKATAFGENLAAKPAEWGRTIKTLATDDAALGRMMADPRFKYGVMSAGIGLAGQEQMAATQEMEEAEASRKAESERKKQEITDQILRNYANVGRSAPWMAATGGMVPRTMGYTTANQMRSSSFTPFVSSAAPQFAQGGQVHMQSGGFVVPKYAVDAAGGGNNERGLAALQRNVGARPIRGRGTGTSDSILATIDGKQPARVSNGEAYVPPKKVKQAGGAQEFYKMLAAAKKHRKG